MSPARPSAQATRRADGSCVVSVSYTHLDVYKRQNTHAYTSYNTDVSTFKVTKNRFNGFCCVKKEKKTFSYTKIDCSDKYRIESKTTQVLIRIVLRNTSDITEVFTFKKLKVWFSKTY